MLLDITTQYIFCVQFFLNGLFFKCLKRTRYQNNSTWLTSLWVDFTNFEGPEITKDRDWCGCITVAFFIAIHSTILFFCCSIVLLPRRIIVLSLFNPLVCGPVALNLSSIMCSASDLSRGGVKTGIWEIERERERERERESTMHNKHCIFTKIFFLFEVIKHLMHTYFTNLENQSKCRSTKNCNIIHEIFNIHEWSSIILQYLAQHAEMRPTNGREKCPKVSFLYCFLNHWVSPPKFQNANFTKITYFFYLWMNFFRSKIWYLQIVEIYFLKKTIFVFHLILKSSKIGNTLNNFLIVQKMNFWGNYIINMFVFGTHQLEIFNGSFFVVGRSTLKIAFLKRQISWDFFKNFSIFKTSKNFFLLCYCVAYKFFWG